MRMYRRRTLAALLLSAATIGIGIGVGTVWAAPTSPHTETFVRVVSKIFSPLMVTTWWNGTFTPRPAASPLIPGPYKFGER
jgi:hypothetical protein